MSQPPFIFSASRGQTVPTLPGLSPQQTAQSTTPSLTAPLQLPAMSATAAQHTNAAATQQNALMAALQGIAPEQLSIIVQALQSGQLPMPPVLPQPQVTAATPTETRTSHAQLALQGQASTTPTLLQDEPMDIDREDGEVEEDEIIEQQNKIMSHTVPAESHHFEQPRQERPGSRSSRRRQKVTSPVLARPNGLVSSRPNGHIDRRRDLHPQEASKRFVLAMHEAGYSFHDLANHVQNETALKDMYEELHLPIPKRDSALPKSTPFPQPPPMSSKQPDTAAAQGKQLPGPRQSQNATEEEKQQKRREYLAKLQAARKTSAPSSTNAATDVSRSEPTPAKAVTMSTSGKPLQPKPAPKGAAKININREELQRRLKKLEAEQASKKERTKNSSINPEPPSMQRPQQADQPSATIAPALGLGSGLDNLTQQVNAQSQMPPMLSNVSASSIKPEMPKSQGTAASTSTPSGLPLLETALSPSLNIRERSFSGLPGLSSATLPGLSFGGSPFSAKTNLQSSYFSLQPLHEANTSYISPTTTETPSVQAQAQTQSIIDPTSSRLPVAASEGGLPGPQGYERRLDQPRKRVVASTFDDDDDDPAGDVPSKRPFGQSRDESTDEEMIIEVSDDSEDQEDEKADQNEAQPSQTYGSIRDMPPLSDMPMKLSFTRQHLSSSTPGTPGSMTPGGLEYQRKILELEEAKRRLAELELRKKSKVMPNIDNYPPTATTPHARTASAEASSKSAVATTGADFSGTAVSSLHRSSSTHLDHSQSPVAKREELERSKLELARRIATLEEKRAAALQQTVVQPTSSPSAENPFDKQKTSLIEAPPAREPAASSLEPPEATYGNLLPATDVLTTSIEKSALVNANLVEEHHATEQEGSDFEDLDDLYSSESSKPILKVSAAGDQDLLPPQNQATGSDDEAIADDEYSPDENVAEDVPRFPEAQSSHLHDSMVSQTAVSTSAASTPYHSDPSTPSVEDVGAEDRSVTREEAMIVSQQLPEESGSSGMSTTDSDDDGGLDLDDEKHSTENEGQNVLQVVEEQRALPGHGAAMTASVDRDLAPELRPQQDTQAEARNQAAPVQHPKRYFTPYRSPLEHFRDFRYHPNFTSVVTGGHQSLTYSHKIDAHRPLCRYESTGSTCNDPTCPDQHFSDMLLNDAEIVQQLGTDYPNHHPEVKVEYNKGLRDIILNMKAAGLINNVTAIAPHLVAYRQQFLQDPSKIIDFEYWQARANRKDDAA